MSNTPRPTTSHIPMMTRNSDVHQIQQCPGAFFLSLTMEDEALDATFFQLGETAHSVIERAISEDLTLEQALALATSQIDGWLSRIHGKHVIESRARTVASMQQDAERLLTNFYKYVWPGSPDRLEIFDSYEWPPPQVEAQFNRTAKELNWPVWGTVDAIFQPKPGTGLPPLIVDWKCGVRRVQGFEQLDHYRFGLGMQHADAAYLYLDRSRRSDVLHMADSYIGDGKVKSRILGAENMKKQMANGGPVPFKPSALCKVCPVAGLCPEQAKGQEHQDRMKQLRIALRGAQPLHEIEVGERVPA